MSLLTFWFLFLGECSMGLLYRLGICSRQLCLYPDETEYLRLFMHFSGLFQPGGQIARKVRQTSNNCSYRGCGGQYSDLSARTICRFTGKGGLGRHRTEKLGGAYEKDFYMSRSHRDGDRKSNLFLSGISCRCYEAKYFPALNDH